MTREILPVIFKVVVDSTQSGPLELIFKIEKPDI